MNLWPLMVFRMKGKKFHINYAVVALLLEYCLSIQWGVFFGAIFGHKKENCDCENLIIRKKTRTMWCVV